VAGPQTGRDAERQRLDGLSFPAFTLIVSQRILKRCLIGTDHHWGARKR